MDKSLIQAGKLAAWQSIRNTYSEITIDALTEYERQGIVSAHREVVCFSHGGWSYNLKSDSTWTREPIPHWSKLTSKK